MYSYTDLRKKYPEFVYHGYEIGEDDSRVGIVYDFEIPGLASFPPHVGVSEKAGRDKMLPGERDIPEAGLLPRHGGAYKLLEDGVPAGRERWRREVLTGSRSCGGRTSTLTVWANSTIRTALRRTRRTSWRSVQRGLWSRRRTRPLARRRRAL